MKNKIHTVLALKYRPKTFNELIGQDVMVQTVVNSIKLNKLPNAYLLTGIRGVGKTTTARIIAKAINCKKSFIAGEKCKAGESCHCDEIDNSRHLDVLEMDAASRTGIDDIRELIDSSSYSPTNAKYKIFIIDEVHMLSRQAFNGLLKTLEEPPDHLKFIFATTEVKKIPVTIISRCQRFDLRRVSIKSLLDNLSRISKIENGKITKDALKLIAKAAEGSVRDSLSLLDRALISQSTQEKEVDETYVRKMLGIADRSRILELFKLIFDGNQESSLEHLREMIDDGSEPTNLLNDFLEIIYLMIRKKDLGDFDSDLTISESELETINLISKDVDNHTLAIFWQFVLKGIEELRIVPNQALSLEMLIFRLIHLKEMPDYQQVLNSIKNENLENTKRSESIALGSKNYVNFEKSNTKKSADQMKNMIQTKSEISPAKSDPNVQEPEREHVSDFEGLIKLVTNKKEIELKYDLEKNVNLVKFSEGKIDISFNEKLEKNFIRTLSRKLFEWTGRRWIISLTKEKGQKTFSELAADNKKKSMDQEKNGEFYRKFKSNFPDAELIDVVKEE